MAAYTLDVLSRHQRDPLFLLFACDFENYIEYFLLRSKFPTLSCNCYKSLHETVLVSSYLFLHSSQLLPY